MVAIILNGTSSSGKTSIARSLQKRSKSPMLHASLDAFTDMFDWDSVPSEEQSECHTVGGSNFHRCLPILASSKFSLIVDHVLYRSDWTEECFRSLEGRTIIFVGVRCPLPILEERERLRGNRHLGLAKSQFDLVHKGKEYDLEFDTSLMSPDQCAATILRRLQPQ